jgi:lipopolysaccharide/colanic/teichoic acid biosynthesis glycosyltransferase
MVQDAPARGASITAGGDPRVTRIGKILRRTKIDELLQLINVLKGDMSLVGPRPEVPKYVKLFRPDFAEILTVRPGVTDLASLKFRDEEAYLGLFGNPEEEYIRSLLPEKIELARQYVRRSSFLFDIGLILRTVWSLGFPGPSQVSLTAHNSLDAFERARTRPGNSAADANHRSREQEQIR